MDEPIVIVALDLQDETKVFSLVDRLQPDLCRLKVGKELFTRHGPRMVERLMRAGFDVFLDLKYHDIPNTAARACAAAASLGVWMINVHALGGRRMLAAAREALQSYANRPLLTAVTVLTSMSRSDLMDIGLDAEPRDMGIRLAALAYDEGLDGIVCSAQEAVAMKQRFGSAFRLVTPGIRMPDDLTGDQRRVMTPVEAVRAGADYLVIGRPIVGADNPLGRLLTINSDIASITSPGN